MLRVTLPLLLYVRKEGLEEQRQPGARYLCIPVCNNSLGAQGALHATTDHRIQLFPGASHNGSTGSLCLRRVFLDRWDSGVVD